MVGNVDHVVLIIGFALRPPCGFPAGRTLRVAIGTPNPRAYLARAVRERIAGDFEAQHADLANGERWFTEQDAIWRVHADTSMFIGGIRALLLQSLHPVAMQAVAEHAGFREDFWGRFQRTSKHLALTTYGTVPDAERTIAAVRAIHRRVTGTTRTAFPRTTHIF